MKWDLKTILYLLVGLSGALALLAMFGVALGLPAIVGQVGGVLLIAGGLLWGAEALELKVF